MNKKIDNLWDSVKKGAETAKTIAGIKMKIAHEKTLLDKLYKNLGKKFYECYCANKVPDTEELCASIKAKTELIKLLQRDLNQLSGVAECSKCHGTSSNKYQYCPFCGAEYVEKTYGTEDGVNAEDLCDICSVEGAEDVCASDDVENFRDEPSGDDK